MPVSLCGLINPPPKIASSKIVLSLLIARLRSRIIKIT